MRIWSLHPKYPDTKGLLACWRETLLAKAVLNGNTREYQNHPQLTRFKLTDDPINTINAYLAEIWNEANSRGYLFDKTKIDWNYKPVSILVHDGQFAYELQHLLKKLETRDPVKYKLLKDIQKAEVHPVFKIVKGGIESWEKIMG